MRVAFITASNLENIGMYTVDRTLVELFSDKNIEFTAFCSHLLPKRFRRTALRLGIDRGMQKVHKQGLVRKELLDSKKQLDAFDKIVFWGDFTLNPNYGYGAREFIERDMTFRLSSQEEAEQRWRDLFFTDDLKVKDVLSFGQNFQHESLQENGAYHSDIKKALSGVSSIAPRDSVSHKIVSELEIPGCAVHTGCDPALLKISSPPPLGDGNYFCYFLARSNINNTSEVIEKISVSTNLPPVELSGWLGLKYDFETRWQNLKAILKGSRFVLTDTYHCAVNAIALGKIPIVISESSKSQDGTLGDFKKSVLLKDLGLQQFHFELNEDRNLDSLSIDHVVETIIGLQEMDAEMYANLFMPSINRSSASKNLLFRFLDVKL